MMQELTAGRNFMSAAPILTAEPETSTASHDLSRDMTGPIVYFDGVCGMCSQSVNVIMAWDRRAVFRFAPLQGETAAARLPEADTRQLASLVVESDGRLSRKSSAVVRILWQLGWSGRLAGTLLWLIPLPLRNLGYRLVAENRYQWFGKKETCRMPTPTERARFLP